MLKVEKENLDEDILSLCVAVTYKTIWKRNYLLHIQKILFSLSPCKLGGFGGFGTTSTTAGSAFSFSAPSNTGTTGKKTVLSHL